MLSKLLYIKGEKALAQKVRKTLGEALLKKIEGREDNIPNLKPVKTMEEMEDTAEILQLQQDPVIRIAGDGESIQNSLNEVIRSFKSKGIDAHLLEQQQLKIAKHIQVAQNLIRSILKEAK
jgi:hypothetical protein